MTTDPRKLPKLLYIEDNLESRILVRRMLGRDFIVLEADNPLDGIELAIDTQPNLVLLDINLPEMNGREVAARLRTLLPATPLVAYSADDSPQARERTLAAGFAGYIDKSADIDTIAHSLLEFLGGKRETLADLGNYQQDFASELVARLEGKIRELTRSAERNEFLNEQNRRMILLLQRRQRLLEAGARVGQIITSILNLDELLNVTVQVICEEYGFAAAAVFLLDASGEWAELKAGHGAIFPAGRLPLASHPLLAAMREQKIHFTANEMTLPLRVKGQLLGALVVRSNPEEPLTEDDQAAFQTLANQAAIAVNNAILLRDLNAANQEILRSKTLQAIATATGEAIHWVGNKAAPIPASAKRVRDDLLEMTALFRSLFDMADEKTRARPGWAAAQQVFATLQAVRPAHPLPDQPLLPLGLESILEDLDIIEQSAQTILDIKEDLLGPARLKQEREVNLPALVRETVFQMGLPETAVCLELPENLPPVFADARQLAQVYNNLLKNAWEAMSGQPDARIWVRMCLDGEQKNIISQVQDNGPGIPPEILEKIWVSFFTTKGSRGGTGLGLSACMEIINQARGKLSAHSLPGQGATFTVELPVMKTGQVGI